MSLTDWCFVMDQHTRTQISGCWGLEVSPQPQPRCDDETGIMNTLRTASCFRRHHQWSSESEMRTFGSSMWSNHLACSSQLGCYLWLEMWQHRVCIERERERRHSKDWHLGCLAHSADGGKLGTVHWLNIHYTESGNTISRNIQPIPHLPASHSYRKWQNIIPDRESRNESWK